MKIDLLVNRFHYFFLLLKIVYKLPVLMYIIYLIWKMLSFFLNCQHAFSFNRKWSTLCHRSVWKPEGNIYDGIKLFFFPSSNLKTEVAAWICQRWNCSWLSTSETAICGIPEVAFPVLFSICFDSYEMSRLESERKSRAVIEI